MQHSADFHPGAGPVAGLVARWTGRPADAETARMAHARLRFDEIGDFLFANNLDLTALNLTCAHDYLSRSNPRLEQAIEQSFARRDPLSNGWVESFYAECPTTGLKAATIASTTRQVEVVLTQCVELVERSRGSAHVYSDALQAEAEQLTSVETLPAVERLIALTQAMLGQTRDIQEELRQRAIETTQLRTTLQSAQREAHIDHLTGLPNRRDFDARLRQAAESVARDGDQATIALCDIDHFKAINDAHGHATGDRVLALVASAFRDAAGDRFYVARFGGEEFAMIFQGWDVAAAGVAIDALRTSLGARRLVNQETGKPIGNVTFSAGIALLNAADGGAASLKLADTALYAAKQGGRDRMFHAAPDGTIAPA